MNWHQCKDPLFYLHLPGTVVALLSLTQETMFSNTIFYQIYFTNSVDFTEFNLEKLD